jgi:exonuclease VII small subunit
MLAKMRVFISLAVILSVWSPIACFADTATSQQGVQLTSLKLEPLPAGAPALYEKLVGRIPARLKPWIANEVKQLNQSQATDFNWPSPSDPAIANQNLSQRDIAAMAVVVILMMIQDGDQDLQQKMLDAQAQMQAKQALRNMINRLNALQAAAPQFQSAAQAAQQAKQALQSLLNRVNQIIAETAGKNAAAPCTPPDCGLNPALTTATQSYKQWLAVCLNCDIWALPSAPFTIGQVRQLPQAVEIMLVEVTNLSQVEMAISRRSKLIDKLSNLMGQISGSEDTVLKKLK